MTLLTLNNTGAVGLRGMNDQHGNILDAMNELRSAILRGGNHDHVSGLLHRLIEFTQMHFECEERLMEQSGFPGVTEHRAEHQSFLAQMLYSVHHIQYGEGVAISPFLRLLLDWFTDHVETLDQQHGQWLNQQGIS